MAKEFDIFLNKHLTECDVIVYAMPFREDLTVLERLILDCCVESYTLQKYVAVQSGLEVVSHIDEMLKTCYERLDESIETDVDIDFSAVYSVYPEATGIEFATEAEAMRTSFAEIQNEIELTLSDIEAAVQAVPNLSQSAIEIDSEITGEHLDKYDNIMHSIEILSDVIETLRVFVIPEYSGISFECEADAVIGNYRLLQDMDESTLLSFDGLLLQDVDFIIR